MKSETFFDNFEALAETPNGVKKLRELILELAVRGKLVAQDEKDEPYQKIIKMESTSIENNETPFELPKIWAWVKLDDIILEASTGLDKPKQHQSLDFNYAYFKMNNISVNGNCNFSDITRIEATDVEVKKYRLNDGDFLFNTRNSYELVGKTCVFENELDEICLFNNNILKITFTSKISSNFMNLWFISPPGKTLLNYLKSSTTNVAAIYQGKLRSFFVPVPPLAEQNRIVAKVDQLMSLCDELEARQQKKRETRAHINSAALDRLLAARAPGEFAEGWRRISDNFDLLYDVPENVDALRKAILQLAVMGKLVAQDENDELASLLLERIKAKKEQFIKEKKIKKEHSFENISEVDIPFDLPNGWVWCRVGDIATIKGGKRLPNGTTLIKVPTNHIYIRVSDMKNGTIDDSDLHYITNEVYEKIKNYIIEKDDLYLTIVGSTIGKLGIVPNKFHKMNLTENAARIIIYEVDRLYINYAMNSQFIQKQFFDKTKQLGQPKLALNRIVSTFFPLPPLAEQHRIVARVDQLMSLCDTLEAGLLRSQADSKKLMEAVVGRMLAGEDSVEKHEG